MEKSVSDIATYEAKVLQTKAWRTLNREFAGFLEPWGLTNSEWALLGILVKFEGATHTQISESLEVSRQMTTKLVNSLESKKLVDRQVGRSDNRKKIICLTPKGREAIKKIEPKLKSCVKDLMAGVDRKKIQAYLDVLNHLANK